MKKNVWKFLSVVAGFILVSLSVLSIIFIESEGIITSIKNRIYLSILGYLLICTFLLVIIIILDLKNNKKK